MLHNLRFASVAARRYQGTGLSHSDVLSAVYSGMLTAAAGFDPTRGPRFVAYAVPLIRSAIRRLVIKGSGAVSLPYRGTFVVLRETVSMSFEEPRRAVGGRTDGTPYTLSDVVPDGRLAIDDVAARDHAREQLKTELARLLSARECEIVVAVYGLFGARAEDASNYGARTAQTTKPRVCVFCRTGYREFARRTAGISAEPYSRTDSDRTSTAPR